jgi:hypothetical protein
MRVIAVACPLVGVPLYRRQRLLEVDRSRPSEDVTAGFLWDFQPQGRLSPAISGEESRWLLRDWRVWGALQSRGVTRGGEGIGGMAPRVPAGNPPLSDEPDRDPACFRRIIRAGFSADVYRILPSTPV